MNDKVRRAARAAKLKASSSALALPDELVELVEQEAQSVYKVMGTAASVLVTNDLALLRTLNNQEESAHGIYEEFFRAYNRMATVELTDDAAYDNLRRVIMISRYLDRCAQYSIDRRLPHHVPAHRPALELGRHRRVRRRRARGHAGALGRGRHPAPGGGRRLRRAHPGGGGLARPQDLIENPVDEDDDEDDEEDDDELA